MKHVLKLSSVGIVAALAAMIALLWFGQSRSGANNPPTTVVGTVVVDPGQDPLTATETPVWAIAEANGRYYIGGNFQNVGGESQPYLAAIEVATGQLDPVFRPVVTGGQTEVLALAVSPDGQDIYVGGRFSQIDGQVRNRVAKLDAVTGALDASFNPNADAAVETIIVNANGVYIGGRFNNVGGTPAARLAKVNANTGALDAAFSATFNGNVLDLEFLGNDLIVGGNYSQLNGADHDNLVRIDSFTGVVSPVWTPAFDAPHRVESLAVRPDGAFIYAGTAGTPSELGNTVWAYTPTGDREWQKVAAGNIQALEATNTELYVGTHGAFVYTEERYPLDVTLAEVIAVLNSNDPTSLNRPEFPANGYLEDPVANPNAITRNNLFSLDPTTGDLLAWDPAPNSTNGVWELASGPSGLLVGGDFTQIDQPTGTTGVGPAVAADHVAIFVGEGNGANAAPEPLFTVDCTNGTTCAVDASASLDDGSITNFAWDFGNGQTASGMTASATLPPNATHDITLTVTDDAGLTTSRTQQGVLGNGGTPITHIGTNSMSGTNHQFSVPLPASAQASDVAIAFLTVNTATTTATPPAGWTAVANEVDGNLRTFVWWKPLSAGDPGTAPQFQLSASVKSDLTVTTFRGVDPVAPVAAIDATPTTGVRADHTAPALSFAGAATPLHYWAERTSVSTEIFAATDLATLHTSIGSLGGRVNSTLALDTVPRTGSSPASVAVTEHHGTTALGISLALVSGGPVAPTCNGLAVTVDIGAGQSPTAGSDVILGTSGADAIAGLAGDDVICGEGGNDTINAGPGNDTVFGGDGDDTIFGLDGDDILNGDDGIDEIVGFAGADTIDGGDGADTLNGGPGNDTVDGRDGDDDIFGQGGDDMLNGGGGNDFIIGVDGVDIITGGAGNDTLNGGPGNDTINGGDNDDIVFGLTGNDTVSGDSGNDQVFGQLGFDIINGGAGDDSLFGNQDDDTITDPSGTNTINGGPGDDTITGGTGSDDIFGDGDLLQAGNDIIDGGAGGPDLLVGFAGDDTIMSTNGAADTVNGGPHNTGDTCTTEGNDTIFNCNP